MKNEAPSIKNHQEDKKPPTFVEEPAYLPAVDVTVYIWYSTVADITRGKCVHAASFRAAGKQLSVTTFSEKSHQRMKD